MPATELTVEEIKGDGAYFSADRRYRYALWRIQNSKQKKVLFILLNPSCADEIVDDPTVKRCREFANRWKYDGGCMVGNLFAYRSTDPEELGACGNPEGDDNNSPLEKMHRYSALTVAAWGKGGKLKDRDKTVLKMLKKIESVSYLELCKNGKTPKHLLYLSYDKHPDPPILNRL